MKLPHRPGIAASTLGLAAVAALVVVVATRGDDDARLEFCDTADQVTDDLADLDLTDTDSVATLADTIDRTNTPPDIADDWATMSAPYQALATGNLADPTVIEQLAEIEVPVDDTGDTTSYDEFADTDLTDPAVAQDLAERGVLDTPTGETADPLQQATANVAAYADEECP